MKDEKWATGKDKKRATAKGKKRATRGNPPGFAAKLDAVSVSVRSHNSTIFLCWSLPVYLLLEPLFCFVFYSRRCAEISGYVFLVAWGRFRIHVSAASVTMDIDCIEGAVSIDFEDWISVSYLTLVSMCCLNLNIFQGSIRFNPTAICVEVIPVDTWVDTRFLQNCKQSQRLPSWFLERYVLVLSCKVLICLSEGQGQL